MNNSHTLLVLLCISLAVTSCNKQSVPASVADETIEHQPVSETGYTDMNYAKWKQGVEFWAVGNEPSWAIDLDFDGEFTLKRLGEEDVAIPAQTPKRTEFGTEYSGSSMSFDLVIRIYDKDCVDPMSGMRYGHRVEVDIRDRGKADFKTYSGCGNYVNDVQLHNIWVLSELDGEAIKLTGLPKGAPRLELDAEDGTLHGHDGCNTINGDFVTKGKKLQIGVIISTMMACPGTMENGSVADRLTEEVFSYAVVQGELRLMQDLKVVARFKAVD